MLMAYIFDTDGSPHLLGSDHISDINILWELHGGLRTVALEWAASKISAYQFYRKHLGHRLLILDQYLDRPVADALITGIAISGTGIRIVANGAWFLHSDELYNFDADSKDSQQGATLVYNPTGQSFQDADQVFTDWQTASGSAAYEIWIVNSDNSVTFGFLGAAFTTTNANDSIYVYDDYALTSAGWNGEDPTAKTASSYTIIICYNYYTTTDVIKDALSKVPFISTGQAFIEETSTVISYWEPPIEEGGLYPAEVIEKLSAMSDSTNRQWNYWVVSGGMNAGLPSDPIPHFAPQSTDGGHDWGVKTWMLSGDSFTAERNIQELRNKIKIIYSDMENENVLAIYPNTGAYVEDSMSQERYWSREALISGGTLDAEMAEYYANLYINKYKDSMFVNSFTISSPYIYDSAESEWPLWTPIKLSRSYFRFLDLFPDAGSLGESWDRKLVSQAMTMEYSSANNELRVVLDTEDNALDAMLSRMDAFE